MGSTNSLFDCSQFAMASITYLYDNIWMLIENGTDDEQNVTILRPIHTLMLLLLQINNLNKQNVIIRRSTGILKYSNL